MTRKEKIRQIQEVLDKQTSDVYVYKNLLSDMGDTKDDYRDYMITEPMDCTEELRRTFEADYDLCSALLTMTVRENYHCEGSFEKRFAEGQILPILKRMKEILVSEV